MSYSWGTERRFNAYGDYFRKLYGARAQKITIDAGFTCPNRDGTCGTGGCTFCRNDAFTPSYTHQGLGITEQIRRGMEFHRTRYRKATRFLAYFQSYTNTYGHIDRLKALYEEALAVPGIAGIALGTRPDCVDEGVLDYLAELNRSALVIVEYGIESLLDRSLERINRGHTAEQSFRAVRETARRGIRTGGHLIIGLPGETRDEILEWTKKLNEWPLDSVKFHQLQVINGTEMAREFKEQPGDFMEFTMEEYLHFMVRVIEHLNPRFVVERIAGEVAPELAVRDGWGVRYDQVLKRFEQMLEEEDSWQGKYYSEES